MESDKVELTKAYQVKPWLIFCEKTSSLIYQGIKHPIIILQKIRSPALLPGFCWKHPLMNSVHDGDNLDKKGDALKAHRFRMLEDIAKELSGDVVFPTYFDAVLRLRKVLQDPDQSISGIAAAVLIEPLISAKLLHLAN